MASSDRQPSPPSLEELSTRSATTLLLPWILGMAAATDSSPREVAVFVHQPTRSVTFVEGALDMESLMREIPTKEGPLPAAKSSIESLPIVQIAEGDWECSICLTDGKLEVKEMPCGHKFHSECVDKWLGIHGSCPVCRYSMPVEENKQSVEGETGEWRIHVFFTRGIRTSGSNSISNSGMDLDSVRDGNSDNDGNDELPMTGQQMELDDSE